MGRGQRASRLLTAIIATAVPAAHAAADIINVPGDQPTIQAGIDAAVNGDEVVVAAGTYIEGINFDGKAITVRSTDPTDPAVVVSTIINGNVIFVFQVVQCVSGEGADSVLSGFVIIGGSADFAPGSVNGGGMYNLNSSPTVSNCTFHGNSADSFGGGMYNEGGSPTVTNCTFHGNSATDGGGMYNQGGSPTVTNCSFIGNSVGISGFSRGGGMHNASLATVTDCTFSSNTADFGGGLSHLNDSSTVTGCTFTENSAAISGGAIITQDSLPTVTNCTISGNTAAALGGGIVSSGGRNPTVSDSVLCANTPDQVFGTIIDGGGLIIGLFCPPPPPPPPPFAGGDLNDDGFVNVVDLLMLLGAWGPVPGG